MYIHKASVARPAPLRGPYNTVLYYVTLQYVV